jgi:hypothetical protein
VNWSVFWEQHSETVWASIIAAIIAWTFGYIYYRLAIRRKRFSWEVMSQNRIIRAPDSTRTALEVLYGGKKMENPNIVVMRFGNTGWNSIHPTDFDGPITLTFERPLLLDVGAPPVEHGFLCSRNCVGQVVELKPQLIQRGEYIDLQFITDGPLEPPKVELRFDGKARKFSISAVKIIRRRQNIYALFWQYG